MIHVWDLRAQAPCKALGFEQAQTTLANEYPSVESIATSRALSKGRIKLGKHSTMSAVMRVSTIDDAHQASLFGHCSIAHCRHSICSGCRQFNIIEQRGATLSGGASISYR